MVLQPGDLSWLSKCCPAVEMLQLRWLGPEVGIEEEWLGTWALSLKLLSVQLWYDDCLGSPPVMEVTSRIIEKCQALEALCITGIDWPRAKAAILQALRGFRQIGQAQPALRRLSLEGSQAWQEDELELVKALVPRVEVVVLEDRTR
ncbi:unnamed protein product [Symbiodinium natans]|uniref:Uncharacterized protein n=1 Tax=Symbiodinium natans TaxID=878477 RepID=A0A812S8K4_9DINO|nr:unnamed protein product [Symbiodinium natans]